MLSLGDMQDIWTRFSLVYVCWFFIFEDVNARGTLLLSGGMDRYVKIWDVSFILSSEREENHPQDHASGTRKEEFPIFSNNQIHVNYVDGVQWLGNLCVSKSISKHIRFWYPGVWRSMKKPMEAYSKGQQSNSMDEPSHLFKIIACEKQPSPMTMLASAELPDRNSLWYIPFSITPSFLVAGMDNGSIALWLIRHSGEEKLLFGDEQNEHVSFASVEKRPQGPVPSPHLEVDLPQAPLSYYGIPDENEHLAKEKSLIDKLLEDTSLKFLPSSSFPCGSSTKYQYSPNVKPQILKTPTRSCPVRGLKMGPDERYGVGFNVQVSHCNL